MRSGKRSAHTAWPSHLIMSTTNRWLMSTPARLLRERARGRLRRPSTRAPRGSCPPPLVSSGNARGGRLRRPSTRAPRGSCPPLGAARHRELRRLTRPEARCPPSVPLEVVPEHVHGAAQEPHGTVGELARAPAFDL